MTDNDSLTDNNGLNYESIFRAILKSPTTGFFVAKRDGAFIQVNDTFSKMTDYYDQVLLSLNVFDLDFNKENSITKSCFEEAETKGWCRFEWKIRRGDKTPLYTSNQLLYFPKEEIFVCILMDITKEKSEIKELEHLCYHDNLTGLYNKEYMKKVQQDKLSEEPLPISVITGDINGLKLINDSYGQSSGDFVITTVAKIFNKCCPDDGIIGRTGGDEFCAILKNTDKTAVREICENIKSECESISSDNHKNIIVSVSLGYATSKAEETNIKEITKKSESLMHKHKLMETRSLRSSTVSLMLKTLQEKNIETDDHFSRMKNLCRKLGSEMDLSDSMLADLELLSVLHDIGKISISDSIINKNAKLTRKEKEEVKKHSEFGFRITQSIIEFQHLSDYILSHHEKWDGTGYPNNLKGNEIPLLSRIIAIVDAYDAMTNVRPYREALPEGYAADEIKSCAGSQFDPSIAKIFVEKVLGKKW